MTNAKPQIAKADSQNVLSLFTQQIPNTSLYSEYYHETQAPLSFTNRLMLSIDLQKKKKLSLTNTF